MHRWWVGSGQWGLFSAVSGIGRRGKAGCGDVRFRRCLTVFYKLTVFVTGEWIFVVACFVSSHLPSVLPPSNGRKRHLQDEAFITSQGNPLQAYDQVLGTKKEYRNS